MTTVTAEVSCRLTTAAWRATSIVPSIKPYVHASSPAIEAVVSDQSDARDVVVARVHLDRVERAIIERDQRGFELDAGHVVGAEIDAESGVLVQAPIHSRATKNHRITQRISDLSRVAALAPPSPPPKGYAAQVRLLIGNVRRAIGIAWRTERKLTVAYVVANVLNALLPVAMPTSANASSMRSSKR